MVEIFDNIHKVYQYKAPCAELSDYIEFYSESSIEASRFHLGAECFSIKLFASWAPTFWFNLGTDYRLEVGGKGYLIKPGEDVLVIRNGKVERQNLPSDHIFTVKFYPGALEAVMGINQTAFVDRVVDLREILADWILQGIRAAGSFEARCALMEDYFLFRMKKVHSGNYCFKIVQEAIDAFGFSRMEASNSDIAKEVFVTDKTLYRYFLQSIGSNPKSYFSTLRVRNALKSYIADRKLFSPYDCGYYDMSHFYKEVVKFTGKKLSDQVG